MNDTIQSTLAQTRPGGRRHGTLEVGRMASGSVVGIPFIVLRGGASGKTLWINGQVHGNEVTGMVAALDFVNALDPSAMRGNIIVTTTANPMGFDGRRKNAIDDNDLDQTFPGRPAGFTSERFAYRLFEEMRGLPDLAINMHTQGFQTIARSYTVYKEHPAGKVAPESLYPYMAAFDPLVACRMNVQPGTGELLGNIPGALDYQLMAIGVPAFMVELGVGQRAEAAEVARGIAGFQDVARRMGIIEGTPLAHHRIRRVTSRGHVSVNEAGLFRPCRLPGEHVPAGTPLGEVMNLHGEIVERPVLERDALIIAIRVDPVVHSSDRFGYMAYAWEDIDF